MLRALSIAALALALGCQAELEDGAYACSDGRCPEGWSCRRDARCYKTRGEEAELLPNGALCTEDGPCEGGLCAHSLDRLAENGQCSVQCTDDRECPVEPRASCLEGRCYYACAAAADCPPPLHCIRPAVAGPPSVQPQSKLCMEVADPQLDGTHGCVMGGSSTDCLAPASCLRHPDFDSTGICSLRCDETENCPGDAVCVNVFTGARHCLARCGEAACTDGLVCGAFLDEPAVCVPPGFVGETESLPPPRQPP
jgi:hypothetical protein